MPEFERLAKGDRPGNVSDQELYSLAKAIPRMLRLIPFIKDNPRFYHARLPCFMHGFCYGGFFRLVTGHLLELWSQGYLRDGELFFFGGVGGFSSSSIAGVNCSTGSRVWINGSFSSLSSATSLVWGEPAGRTVIQPPLPEDRAEFSELLEAVYNNPLSGDCEFPPPPEVRVLKNTAARPSLPEMDFVKIPSGVFLMGYTEKAGYMSDAPCPGVPTAVNEFELLSTPVTAGMWNSVAQLNSIASARNSSAVHNLNWHESTAFAQVLSSIDTTYNYRLPTEAEFEYAAKTGKTIEYCHDAELLQTDTADNNTARDYTTCCSPPNSWGLYDMCGLTGQWCANRFNPVFPVKEFYHKFTKGGYRVVKGGNHSSVPGFQIPWLRREGNGFRLVRTPGQVL